MDEKAQEAELKAQSEAGLAAKAVEKAKKVEAKATREAAQEAKREAKEAKMVALKAKKEAKLAAKAVEKAKKVEAKATRRDEILARQERNKRATVDQRAGEAEAAAKAKATKEVNAQLYEGTINLVLMPPVGVLQIENLKEKLCLIQNLRVILTGGSVDEPNNIVVSAEQPIPLIDVLNHIPIVDEVTKKGKEIQILLKTGP